MIDCKVLLRKDNIDTYFEFLFIMALACECGDRGDVLDITGMSIKDKGMLSDEDIKYLHYLRSKGYIEDGSKSASKSEKIDVNSLSYYMECPILHILKQDLVEIKGGRYAWSLNYAYNAYNVDGISCNEYLGRKVIGAFMLRMVAYMLIAFDQGELPKLPLDLSYTALDSGTASMYLALYACSKSIPVLKDFVTFHFGDTNIDLDWVMSYSKSKHSGRFKRWSYRDKMKIFEKYNFKVGSIAVLYTRSKVSESNKIGKITDSVIVRIDDIKKTKSGCMLEVTRFNVNRTIEEKEEEYLGISEEYRDYYVDLLTPKMNSSASHYEFIDLGIGDYFSDEDYLLFPIDRNEYVTKTITIDGRLATVELSEVEAIYWTLCQYEVDFDRDMYTKDYNDDENLMWDRYDGTPKRRFSSTGKFIGL